VLDEVHVWEATLDRRSIRADARRLLLRLLGGYLDREPEEIELRLGPHGKPALAEPEATLRFNLSHSGERALIGFAQGEEIGIDIQRFRQGGRRRPVSYYAAWARREAVAKCHGTGLWRPLPDAPVAVRPLDVGPGFAAAVAVAGEKVPPVRRFDAEPADLAAFGAFV
jgi:phosphopantetheinyl transferase